ncbi:serine/threonine protein kinase, FIKK family, putative [Plasmodium sp. gorilla clade G2]|uniref:serine/threonine protein kinase, FIKK family, putative n=1 Tax=Plasmodium sp. gorilla clade G2 TaxID=880535 RepID=UPI000D2E90BD|nr:serine/threonine protein kinase, FIKK family, putative [Plasmodium sp. gorilla clade G2]SOV20067.1 serine/threonine protein kinase, FIKK family, putative [Plasmodium sp. gorilla clade G2]
MKKKTREEIILFLKWVACKKCILSVLVFICCFLMSFNIFEPRIEIIKLDWYVRYHRHLSEVCSDNNDRGERKLYDKYHKYNKEKTKAKYKDDKFNKKKRNKENNVSVEKEECERCISLRENYNNKENRSYNENENIVNLENIKLCDNTTWKYKIKKFITCSYNRNEDEKVVYNWKLGKNILGKMINSTADFSINGINYKDWELNTISDIGYSQNNRRIQKVFKTEVKSKNGKSSSVKLFIKIVPASVWVRQFNILNEHKGEYLLSEENFVMEAISLAFLNKYYPGIAPKFYGILYETCDNNNDNNVDSCFSRGKYNNLKKLNHMLKYQLRFNKKANIIIISELYGEDIYKYVQKRRMLGFLGNRTQEKKKILHESLKLLTKLHETGLSHLDLSPENILIGKDYELRLCDFANTAPIYTYNNRHVKGKKCLRYYESYQPCISKIPLLPPECWNIVRIHESLKINDPYEYLKSITNQEERKRFYYNVTNADKFMLGVFFIWIWNNSYIWESADSFNDRTFRNFVKCGMDLYNFEFTFHWPDDLKDIINQLLSLENREKLNLKELCNHPWWFR